MPNKKEECDVCHLQRWTTEFGEQEGAASTCLYCCLKKKFEETCSALQQRIVLLEQVVTSQEGTISLLSRKLEDTGRTPVESEERSGSAQIGTEGVRESAQIGTKNEKGAEVKKKKKEKKKKKKKKTKKTEEHSEKAASSVKDSNEAKTERKKQQATKVKENREDRRVEGPKRKLDRPVSPSDSKGGKCASVTIVGDSLARGLKPMMGARLRTDVDVRCLPGRGNGAIRTEVEKCRLSESSVVALMVSGNDLYLRGGRIGSADGIIREVMSAVDDCGLKTRRRVVIGMLPRRSYYKEAQMRNRMINERLSELCTAEGVFFIDPYRYFFGRDDLIKGDGVHLTLRGQAVLCNMMADLVRRTLRCVEPRVNGNPRCYAPVTSNVTFSQVVKQGKGSASVSDGSKKSGNGRV